MAPKLSKSDFPIFSKEADRDYLLARLIHFLGAAFQSRAGFFAQQACEKYLKALSVQQSGTYLGIHKLLELAKVCEPYGNYFSDKETLRILQQFDVFDQVGRYGGAANYDPVSKGQVSVGGGVTFNQSPDFEIVGAWYWSDQCLQDLDNIVFHMRAYLNFSNTNYADELRMLLQKDQRCHLAATELWAKVGDGEKG